LFFSGWLTVNLGNFHDFFNLFEIESIGTALAPSLPYYLQIIGHGQAAITIRAKIEFARRGYACVNLATTATAVISGALDGFPHFQHRHMDA
jgi:hypothetical protein